MHFVKIGQRAINFDNVSYIEHQQWHDCLTIKIHFVGQGNTPLVLSEQDAKGVAEYVEYVAEQPISS